MKTKGDKSKGFAYVEFVSVDSVPVALKKDRSGIAGRPMYVSICNRKREEYKPKLKVCLLYSFLHIWETCNHTTGVFCSRSLVSEDITPKVAF